MFKFLVFSLFLCFIASCSSSIDDNSVGVQNMKKLDSTNEFATSEKKGTITGVRETKEEGVKAFSGVASGKR